MNISEEMKLEPEEFNKHMRSKKLSTIERLWFEEWIQVERDLSLMDKDISIISRMFHWAGWAARHQHSPHWIVGTPESSGNFFCTLKGKYDKKTGVRFFNGAEWKSSEPVLAWCQLPDPWEGS